MFIFTHTAEPSVKGPDTSNNRVVSASDMNIIPHYASFFAQTNFFSQKQRLANTDNDHVATKEADGNFSHKLISISPGHAGIHSTILGLQQVPGLDLQGGFFNWPPLKSSKYKKVNLG